MHFTNTPLPFHPIAFDRVKLEIHKNSFIFVKHNVTKMNNRLIQFLAAENISQAQFADTIGVARASVSHIVAGRNKPGFDFIQSTAEHYPNLNIEWLIAGRGRMYKNVSGREAPVTAADAGESAAGQEEEAVILFPEDRPRETAPDTAGATAGAGKSQPESAKPAENLSQQPDTQRKIKHILVLYDDGTYSILQ